MKVRLKHKHINDDNAELPIADNEQQINESSSNSSNNVYNSIRKYLNLKNYQEAIADYQTNIQTKPNNVDKVSSELVGMTNNLNEVIKAFGVSVNKIITEIKNDVDALQKINEAIQKIKNNK